MPSFPIIDTHLHLWDPQHLRYPWLDDIPLLNQPYLLEHYKKATTHIEVDKMVFLQCECIFEQCEQEAAWITKLAQIDSRIQGIVPWAPLEKGEKARDVLDRFSENNLVKGIRRIIQFEPDIEFCLQSKFIRGVQLLADYDFSFDICISHIQLKNAIKFVKQCPEVQFMFDHIGKPDIKNQVFEPWKTELRELARMENVHCKISGLVTEANHKHWKKEDLKPYMDHVLECFGVDRICFGGDWPVAFQATEYPRWVETLDWALEEYSEDDLRKIYTENAIAFYKL